MKALIKTLLNEAIFDKSSKQHLDLFNKFIHFASHHLKIKDPDVRLQFNRNGLVTTASYGNKKVVVYAKERS